MAAQQRHQHRQRSVKQPWRRQHRNIGSVIAATRRRRRVRSGGGVKRRGGIISEKRRIAVTSMKSVANERQAWQRKQRQATPQAIMAKRNAKKKKSGARIGVKRAAQQRESCDRHRIVFSAVRAFVCRHQKRNETGGENVT